MSTMELRCMVLQGARSSLQHPMSVIRHSRHIEELTAYASRVRYWKGLSDNCMKHFGGGVGHRVGHSSYESPRWWLGCPRCTSG
jgi:hypothetical protein